MKSDFSRLLEVPALYAQAESDLYNIITAPALGVYDLLHESRCRIFYCGRWGV